MPERPLFRDMKSLSLTVLYLAPSRSVRGHVPSPLRVAEVLPGLTLCGLFASRYGEEAGKGAVNEFGVLRSYVAYGGKRGFCIENFCTENRGCAEDSDGTESGGFAWSADDKWLSLEVSRDGSPLVRISITPVLTGVPYSTSMPFLCVKGSNVVYVQNHLISRVNVARSRVAIPEGSTLGALPPRVKLVSAFWDTSNIVLREPEYATSRGLKRPENIFGNPIGKNT